MSVLVKGMEMPTSCHACDMLELSGVVGCNHAYDTKNSVWGRALNCPLVEVPTTHGRLIDADVLAKKMREYGWHHADSTVHEFIEDDLPTIIEAEVEE